ncbi:MAG: SUMF1/EgtB/PvdO family nonheme iron enzyme [Saprospiraceae bacterium]|jgi:gliding motility-associated lipoprotein GldK|nr:SUMF1/EgtB/PvdO family nonheme iron enzyme [Saprospiraceae bacterium]
MKKLFVFLGIATLLATIVSCGGRTKKQAGQLIGVEDRPKWNGINPYGMLYIPSGTFESGVGDQDLRSTFLTRGKVVSIDGFYMDDTEISVNEYRQFINWVRDSLVRTSTELVVDNEETGEKQVDWESEIDWSNEAIKDLYFQGDDVFEGNRQEFNVNKLIYAYDYFDWDAAVKDRSKNSRKKYITKMKVPVFPDTLVWVRDFAYSYNEPLTRNYFWHPAYDDYPIVGVSWPQAMAFCNWRSKIWNMYRPEEANTEGFRLPSEQEWEYAARGGKQDAPYPWGAYYTRNAKGCLLANFKPGRGNYPEDGGQRTVKVDSYFPNDYGLYCMAGNVSEWTRSAFVENANSFVHDMNPDIRYNAKETDNDFLKRKVIKGGSWKDILYFLRNEARTWEYQDSSKSYIGFRCALNFNGRSINDFN